MVQKGTFILDWVLHCQYLCNLTLHCLHYGSLFTLSFSSELLVLLHCSLNVLYCYCICCSHCHSVLYSTPIALSILFPMLYDYIPSFLASVIKEKLNKYILKNVFYLNINNFCNNTYTMVYLMILF